MQTEHKPASKPPDRLKSYAISGRIKAAPVSWRAGAVFILALFGLAIVWQVPFTYTLNIGTSSDDWAIMRGFGEREQNPRFSFRWTIDQQAEVRLPEVGWPSRIGLVATAPRPDGKPPAAFLATGSSRTDFGLSPSAASQPPSESGLLTFEATGPTPRLSLKPFSLTIGSEVYQPQGDPRTLGLVVNQVYIQPRAGRFGLVLPPLALMGGAALVVALLYLNLSHLFSITRNSLIARQKWLTITLTLSALTLIIALRLLVPGWFVQNGAGIAWGMALPLGAIAIFGHWKTGWRSGVLLGLLAFGALAVMYGAAPASFTMALFVTTGLIWGGLALRHNFGSHLENCGLLISLTAGVAWGLWQGRLPRTDDVPHYHLYWINELDALIRQGVIYPRWSPDFSWQQGGAVFNYYPPASRYLPELLHLGGLSFNSAIMLVQWATLIFGALGAYFWTLEIIGQRRAALLGGLAFCYFPYNIAEVYAGGGLGNSISGAVLPWVYWRLTRLVRQPDERFGAVWLGLAGAGLALSNNPQLIIFGPIAGLYLLGLLLIEGRAGRLDWRRTLLGLTGAAGLALGLSGFFLLPATLESSKIGLIYAGRSPDFFAELPASLALWQPIYPNLQKYALFGTLHFGLGAIGWLASRLFYKQGRAYLSLLAGMLGLTFILQLPISSFFWDSFRVFDTIQFTARLMNSGVVFAAPLIGGLACLALPPPTLAKVQTNYKKTILGIVPALLVFGLMLYACLYDLTYAYWPPTFDGTISQKALTEQVGNGDAMFLPKGIKDPEIVSRYRGPVFEDGRASSPTDRLKWKLVGPDRYILTATVSRPGTVSLPLFWFEDWWQVNDNQSRRYEARATPDTRLVKLDIPAGEYELSIKLQDVLIRSLANLLSIGTALGLGGYVTFVWRRSKKSLPIQAHRG